MDYIESMPNRTVVIYDDKFQLHDIYRNNKNKENLNIKDNPTPEQKKIIEMPFDSSDKAVSSEISDKDAVLSTMHQMANTKIIAEDGLIWGLKAMTKERVENMKDGLKKTELDSDTKLVEMLDRWAKQDFSNCVEDHNYIWDHYLHGTVGKAVKLR
jgi:hypothetical protein